MPARVRRCARSWRHHGERARQMQDARNSAPKRGARRSCLAARGPSDRLGTMSDRKRLLSAARRIVVDRKPLLAVLAGATGGAIAIGIMEAFSMSTAYPLMAIPFATSIVTVLGSPGA